MSETHAHVSRRRAAGLPHPIVDADAHTVEFVPAFLERLADVGSPALADEFITDILQHPGGTVRRAWYGMSDVERRDRRVARNGWWGVPAENTLDRATAMLPELYHERLDELGLDYSIVYPTLGLFLGMIPHEELRIAACRALNIYQADMFATLGDRLAPVATIPMHTVSEAIETLEHAVEQLGHKVVMFNGFVMRPVKRPPGTTGPGGPGSPTGTTSTASTASTTTTRSGNGASTSGSRRPRTGACRVSERSVHPPTGCTTTRACSRLHTRLWRRRCSSAA